MTRRSRAGLWVALSFSASTWACGAPANVEAPKPAKPASGAGETIVIAERVPVPPPPPPPPPPPKAVIEQVLELGDKLATTTVVSNDGRKFVSFPRWFKDNEAAQQVAEVMSDGTLKAFPDEAWNSWVEGRRPNRKLVCAQALAVDAENRLWILDTGAPYWGTAIANGPKLVGVDLGTNKVQKIIRFDAKVAPDTSYLNDVRIDPNGKLAYVTDSNLGRILVVDLEAGKSRIVLADSPATKYEEGVVPVVEGVAWKLTDGKVFKVNVDGLAIAGDYLYFHAVTGKTMYRIKLDLLRDPKQKPEALAAAVEKVAETGVHDGIAADASGNVYLTQVEENAIHVLRPDGTQETLIEDARLQWPDSIGIASDGLYVTVSQVHLLPVFNGGESKRKNPYRVFRVVPRGWGEAAAAAAGP